MLLGRGAGHGWLLFLYAFGLVVGCLPWVMEAAGLPRAESRRFLFERFLRVEWLLSAALTAFVAAKLMRRDRGLKHSVALTVLFALELLLVSSPISVLLYDMGAGSGREWMSSQAELLAYLTMLAGIAVLFHLVLSPPLAALGATYAAAGGLLWIGGGAGLWLTVFAVAAGLAALRAHRSFSYED